MPLDQPLQPDTKDWTWVLEQPCGECGFASSTIRVEDLPDLFHANTRGWFGALDVPDAALRPDDSTWSRLEYACHVRDVHRIFGDRVRLMLDAEDPLFDNWDQDIAAVQGRYGEQDPAVVGVELVEAAADVAALYSQVAGDQWARPGRRSNGSVFTVATIGSYHLHDVVHHLHDIGLAPS